MQSTKTPRSKIEYHKCAKDGCEAKCSAEFCRHHSFRTHKCARPDCTNTCFKEYCHRHKPETMAKAVEYQRQLYFSRKGQSAN